MYVDPVRRGAELWLKHMHYWQRAKFLGKVVTFQFCARPRLILHQGPRHRFGPSSVLGYGARCGQSPYNNNNDALHLKLLLLLLLLRRSFDATLLPTLRQLLDEFLVLQQSFHPDAVEPLHQEGSRSEGFARSTLLPVLPLSRPGARGSSAFLLLRF